MATIIRGSPDALTDRIKAALEEYEHAYPGADAAFYRQNSVSVRVRIVDQRFAKLSKGDRHDQVWDFLQAHLDNDSLDEISLLLLLAPSEQEASFMNSEFNDPLPSML